MTELYNHAILKLATSIPLTERLAAPDVSVVKTSRICGSRVTVDIDFDEERIAAYGQEVKACALGQAACSIIGRQIIGRDQAEIEKVAADMRKMLTGAAEGPDGDWVGLRVLQPAREHKSRHTSIMLAFDGILEGFRLNSAGKAADTGS